MLTKDEYNHIVRNRAALKDQIKDAKELGLHHKELAEGHKADFDRLKEEMSLYTNFLKDAIEEYLKAHPPEEPGG
ncbi:unnamed protein product [marine sediment metagenome]|uniref:Uncharacterized protein n=1 Tax=marine sediment metagenome TaxID=412755 RepID=X1UIC1_9ZZZZ